MALEYIEKIERDICRIFIRAWSLLINKVAFSNLRVPKNNHNLSKIIIDVLSSQKFT